MNYPSIQDSLPDKVMPLSEVILRIIYQCYVRGISHAGQQDYIVHKVLEDYVFADACPD